MNTPARPGASRKPPGRTRPAKAGRRARPAAGSEQPPETPAGEAAAEQDRPPKRRPGPGKAADPASAPAPASPTPAEPPAPAPAAAEATSAGAPGKPDSPPERPTAAPVAAPVAPVGFDELHQLTANRLAQQAYLLTGSRPRAVRCVERAFELAWTHWPEVSADPSPEGWLRATVFEQALSPWYRSHRLLLAQLSRKERFLAVPLEPRQLTEDQQTLLRALLQLPRTHRRALVLHDVVGLDWKQTSTETESTTPAAYARTVLARRAMAEAAPGIVGADPLAPGFGRRLGALLRAAAVRGCPPTGQAAPADALRRRSALRERAVTAVAGVTALMAVGALLAGATLGTPFHPPAAPFVTYGSIHGRHPAPQPVSAQHPSGPPSPAVGLPMAPPVAGVPRRAAVQAARHRTVQGSGGGHYRQDPQTQVAPHRNRPGRGNSSSRRAQPPSASD